MAIINAFEHPACTDCLNNPKNGGSGVCFCTLPYMQNTTMYDNTYDDNCCMTATTNTGVYVFDKEHISADTQSKDNINRIAEAKANISKYLKKS